MLAIIEHRMCADDRKVYVWARHLENCGGKGTVAQLIVWMNTEMKSRMRLWEAQDYQHGIPSFILGRTLTLTGQNKSPTQVLTPEFKSLDRQCKRFTLLSTENRIRAVNKDHVCFSCLKRAGRDHKSGNCSRKCQCPQNYQWKPVPILPWSYKEEA